MFKSLFNDIRTGLITGFITVLIVCSYAAFIFTGELSHHLPTGFGILLISLVLLRLIIAKFSDVPGVVAAPHNVVCLLIALMATSISQDLAKEQLHQQIFPTVIALIFFSTLALAITLLILGYFNLGCLVRYIPYPVVCGVLAGIGFSLLLRGFYIITNFPITLKNLSTIFQEQYFPQIVVGLFIALLLSLLLKKKIHFSLIMLLLVGFGLLFYFAPPNWFIGPIPNGRLWPPQISIDDFSLINWSLLAVQIPQIGAMILTLIIAFLFNTASVEAFTKKDMDIDHELRLTGWANLMTAFCGGIGGCQVSNPTILNLQLGGKNYTSAIISSLLIIGILFFDASNLNYLPKVLLAGITIYFGLTFLLEWGYYSRYKISAIDYFMVIFILAIIGFFGFLPGVVVGISIAAAIFILTYSQTDVIKYALKGTSFQSNVDRPLNQEKLLKEKGERIYVIKLQGFIFFGTAYTFLEKIKQWTESQGQHKIEYVILDFSLVSNLDSSAILSFVKLHQLAKDKNFVIVFSNVNLKIRPQFVIGGYKYENADTYHFFPDLDYAFEWCEDQIVEKESLPPLEYVLPEVLKEAFVFFDTVYYEKGEYLFHQGDQSNGLYFILSGMVTVLLKLSDGREKRLRTIKAGTFVGELGFYTGLPRSTSIRIENSTVLLFITKNKFLELKSQRPQLILSFYENTIYMLAERVVHDNKAIQALLY